MANHILKHDGKILASLYKNLERLRELNRLIGQYLDKSIAEHCAAASLENNVLTLIADNGNWATQCRFQTPDLLENLRKHKELCALKTIVCKTRPNILLENARKKPPRKMKKLSASVAEKILSIAESIQDEKLKRSLKKIAARK